MLSICSSLLSSIEKLQILKPGDVPNDQPRLTPRSGALKYVVGDLRFSDKGKSTAPGSLLVAEPCCRQLLPSISLTSSGGLLLQQTWREPVRSPARYRNRAPLQQSGYRPEVRHLRVILLGCSLPCFQACSKLVLLHPYSKLHLTKGYEIGVYPFHGWLSSKLALALTSLAQAPARILKSGETT